MSHSTYSDGPTTVHPQPQQPHPHKDANHPPKGKSSGKREKHISTINEIRTRCVSNYQSAVIGRIHEWVQGSGDDSSIFWLTGSPGSGKSAVAKQMARSWYQQKILGASFFFSKEANCVGNSAMFVNTICRQLYENIPRLKEAFPLEDESIPENGDPSWEDRWNRLVVKPLSCLDRQPIRELQAVYMLVIDGLDGNVDGPDPVLRLLAQLPSNRTVRLLTFITNRPNPELEAKFASLRKKPVTRMDLGDVLRDETLKTLTSYIDLRLHEIYKNKGRLGVKVAFRKVMMSTRNSLELEASECSSACSGQSSDAGEDSASDASSVIASISQEIVGLDRIYNSVFTPSLRKLPKVKPRAKNDCVDSILGSLAVTVSPLVLPVLIGGPVRSIGAPNPTMSSPSPRAATPRPGTPADPGPAIASPVKRPSTPFPTAPPSPPPAVSTPAASTPAPSDRSTPPPSVPDADPTPTALTPVQCPNAVATNHDIEANLTRQCLLVMKSSLKFNICNQRRVDCHIAGVNPNRIAKAISSELEYACANWARHYRKSNLSSKEGEEFLRIWFLQWLEAMCWMQKLPSALEALHDLDVAFEASQKAALPIRDFIRFIQANQILLEAHPLQVYCSALLFTPESNAVSVLFRPEIQRRFPAIRQLPVVRSDEQDSSPAAFGQDDEIQNITFSIDGSNLAATLKNVVKLWNPVSGRIRGELCSPSDKSVSALSFLPDGTLRMAGIDTTPEGVVVWVRDSTADSLSSVIDLPIQSTVTTVSLLTTDMLLVELSNGPAQLWDLRTNIIIRSFASSNGKLLIRAFHDGSQMAALDGDELSLWKYKNGEVSLAHTLRVDPFNTLMTYSQDGSRLIVQGSYGIHIVNTESGTHENIFTYDGFEAMNSQVKIMALSPDGRLMVSKSPLSRSVDIWDILTGKLVRTLDHSSVALPKVAFSPNGRRFALVSGKKILLLDTKTVVLAEPVVSKSQPVVKQVSQQHGPFGGRPNTDVRAGPVESLHFSPNGESLAALIRSNQSSALQLWKTSQPAFPLVSIDDISFVGYSWLGDLLVVSTVLDESCLDIVCTQTGNLLGKIRMGFVPSSLTLLPGNRILAEFKSVAERRAEVWDLSSQTMGFSFERLRHLTISQDRCWIATTSDGTGGGIVELRNIQTGETVQRLREKGLVKYLMLSPDASTLAVSCDGKTTNLWNLQNSKLRGEINRPFDELVFTADGQFVITTSTEGQISNTIRVWNSENGRLVKAHRGFSGPSSRVTISQDSKFLFMKSGSRTKLKHLTSDRPAPELAPGLDGIGNLVCASFSPDSRSIVAGFDNGVIRLLSVHSGEPVETIPTGIPIERVDFVPSDRMFLVSSTDRTFAWDRRLNAVVCDYQLQDPFNLQDPKVVFSKRGGQRPTINRWTRLAPIQQGGQTVTPKENAIAVSSGLGGCPGETLQGSPGQALYVRDTSILVDAREIIRIPVELRARCTNFWNGTIAWGTETGDVHMMKIGEWRDMRG